MRPQRSMGLREKCPQARKYGQSYVAWAMPAPSSKNPEEREFAVDSARIPTTVVTANGEMQTNEEAQVYVHDLDLFVTVQILDDNPAVPSFGKLVMELDLATQWNQSGSCKTQTSQETERTLRKFLEQSEKPKVIYTGSSLEFGKSCEDL